VTARSAITAAHALVLVLALAATAASSRAADWHDLGLLAVLLGLALLSELMVIETGTLRISGSFVALVVAMVLLGPAPAVAIAIVVIAFDAARTRLTPWLLVCNLAAYATFSLAGGLLARAWQLGELSGWQLALAAAALGATCNLLNFVLVAVPRLVTHGERFDRQLRSMFLPVLPAELLAAALAGGAAALAHDQGVAALAGLVVVLVLFQWLVRELVKSQTRAEQLEVRTQQLGSLQVGVLAALVQTLSLRDKMTARHSAAVARYARAIAEEVGCTHEEQELVHTAGLLHDIGKFAFPDEILLGKERLTDEQYEVVKRHPGHGERLLRRVDGYGPVADIVHAHHERLDGDGYPRGLRGEEVPRLSRMISIADTYDVMTSRDSYREPVSREEAVLELRRVSGSQLDGELVEAFVRVLAKRGLAFQHTTDADFEAELGFSRRVRALALPVA
jgi:putative nucleotidyltransferase with HDIG domain